MMWLREKRKKELKVSRRKATFFYTDSYFTYFLIFMFDTGKTGDYFVEANRDPHKG